MDFTFGHWEEDGLLETLFYKILGNVTIDKFTPDVNFLSLKNYPQTILDFGCGIGRNCLFLCQDNPTWNIVGYDNEMMLEKIKDYSLKKYDRNINTFTNLTLHHDWNEIKKIKFDWIVCLYVLQHIKESDLDIYLEDFKKIGCKLLVRGREWLDELEEDRTHKNVEKIMERHNLIVKINLLREIPIIHGIPQPHYVNIHNL
jgi:cyclopropane fatty-acyl-phospholipid synthase-like methyltransferase